MESYKEFQKFRSEIFKTFGLIFCTPFGIIVLKLLTDSKIVFELGLTIRLIVSIVLLIMGLIFLQKSIDIMEELIDGYVYNGS